MRYQLSTLVSTLAIAAALCSFVARASPKSTLVTLAISPDPDQQCFASNPDIAGIGVRVSTYAQSFLLFFTTLLCIADGVVDSRERKALEKSYANLLITACALLISAAVQAVASQLSIFHALIVLDWSWMLTINALILAILPTLDRQIEIEWRKWMRSLLPSRIGQIRAMILVSLHMSLLGAFGVYIWWHPAKFQGPSPDPASTTSPDSALCLQHTITYVFFARIRASNPTLRIASIVCYSILALPLINVTILTTMAVLIVNAFMAPFRSYSFVVPYRITWGVQTVVNIFIVINTERTIRGNKHLVSGGESTWGFGQILAVILIVAPVIETFSVVKEKLKWKWKGVVEYWFQPFLREAEDTWKSLYHVERQAVNEVVGKLETCNQHLDDNARNAVIGAFRSATQFFRAADFIMHPEADSAMRPQVADSTVHPRSPSWSHPIRTPSDATQTLEDQRTAMRPLVADSTVHSRSPSWSHPTRTPSDATQAPEDPRAPETKSISQVQNTTCVTQTSAKEDIEKLHELVSRVCELRVPDVRDAKSFIATKAYLRATKEALDAALCALEAD